MELVNVSDVKFYFTTCKPFYYMECRLAYWVWRTVPFPLAIIGTVGNILNILILSRERMRKYSTNVYLLFLAVSDLLNISVSLMSDALYSITGSRIRDQGEVLCKTSWWFRLTCQTFSVYLLVLLTIDRTLLTRAPIWSRKRLNPRNASLTSVCSLVFCGLLSSHFIYGFTLEKATSTHTTGSFTQNTILADEILTQGTRSTANNILEPNLQTVLETTTAPGSLKESDVTADPGVTTVQGVGILSGVTTIQGVEKILGVTTVQGVEKISGVTSVTTVADTTTITSVGLINSEENPEQNMTNASQVNTVALFDVLYQPCTYISREYKMFYDGPWRYMMFLLYTLLPTIIIFIGNANIARGLLLRKKKSATVGTMKKVDEKSKQNTAAARLVVLLSVFFVITTMPFLIYHILRARLEGTISLRGLARWQLATVVTVVLLWCNCCFNFFFYFMNSTLFKQEWRNLVEEMRKKFRSVTK